MSETAGLLADPQVATLIVIAAMAAVTYACRAGGYAAMGFVALTPRVRRALDALPGSIVVATVAPLMLKGGPVAIAAVVAGVATMAVTRKDLAAIVVGIGVAIAARALGY